MFFIAIAIGYMLLIIPGILAMLAWSVAIPAFAVERPGILRSFRRSAQLTKGSRWRIFGLFLIIGVVYLIEFIVLAEFGLVSTTPPPSGQFGALNIIASIITALVFNLLWGTIQPALYLELRGSRDGDSIQSLEEVFA